jgi:hypothetical protein
MVCVRLDAQLAAHALPRLALLVPEEEGRRDEGDKLAILDRDAGPGLERDVFQ